MPASELAFSGAAVSSTSSYIPPRGIHDAFDSESTSTLRQSIRGIEAQLVDLVCQSWTLEELIGWLRVPLECAAFTGNAAALKRLLAAGVTIEVPPGRRQPLTLLHLAAKSGNAGAVEKFVRAGVDVYETGSALDDGAALHCAAAARNDAVVRALARTKTDVGALNARGSSLLQYACVSGNQDVWYFRCGNEPVRKSSRRKDTHFLSLAAIHKHPGVIEDLLAFPLVAVTLKELQVPVV